MLDLVREGTVTIVPNKGFRVTEVDEASLDQLTQIRQLLEPPVVGRVTPHVPVEDLPGLRAMAQRIVDGAAAGDLVAYTEADREFHLRLLAYDGNPRLVDLVAELAATGAATPMLMPSIPASTWWLRNWRVTWNCSLISTALAISTLPSAALTGV